MFDASSAGGQNGRKPPATLGVLYTGYLQKHDLDAWSNKSKNRFIVLTHESLHWFKRTPGQDLFGEERGHIPLSEIEVIQPYTSRPGYPPDACFLIKTKDFARRVWVAKDREERDRWLHAVDVAKRTRNLHRRQTISNLSFLPGVDESHTFKPKMLLLSVDWPGEMELVAARSPDYSVPVQLPPIRPGDVIVLTFTNGSITSCPAQQVLDHINRQQAWRTTVRGAAARGQILWLSTRKAGSAAPLAKPSVARESRRAWLLQNLGIVLVSLSSAFALLSMLLRPKPEGKEPTSLLWTARNHPTVLVNALIVIIFALGRALDFYTVSTKKEKTNAVQRIEGILLEVVDYQAEMTRANSTEEPLPPLPQRYIDGCLGDIEEATRRWSQTVKWRKEYGTDDILNQPHPLYDVIKACYPHYYCMAARDGNPIYVERSGQIDQARLKAAGVGIDKLVWHAIYMTEFLYSKLYPTETAKNVTVFDVEGVGIRDLAGDAFDFLRSVSHVIQEHYPERSKVIMIVNAPGWFSFLWKMIRPLVNERTQQKVRIVKSGSATTECIQEFIDVEKIPAWYGGKLSFGEDRDSCRWHSPEETATREHICAVNRKHGVEMIKA